MRILQVITLSILGGAQSVVINLANNLCKNHDVIVAAGEGDGKIFNLLNDNIKKIQLKRLKRELSPLNDIACLWELKTLYKKYKPDVIHLHSSKAGLLGRLVFPKHKILYTVHGFDSIRIAHRKFLPLEKLLQYRCQHIVGVSLYDYHNLQKEGITHGITCIYNGITKPKSTHIPHINIFKKYEKIILCIARVSYPKRLDIFIETSKLLPEYGFIWIGNETEINNLPSNCHFLGNLPNAGAYCSFADIFMLPSNFEGLPMVILEAMSYSKPIIASNVGGIHEIVQNNINGFTVDNIPNSFADKIKYLLTTPNEYTKFALASNAIFNEKLTSENMVNEYLKIYNQIINPK